MRRLGGWGLCALGACALGLAWQLRFVQDDAFISFAYARSLVEGTGLTWFGDRVEGYTNFLWVLWIALGLELGVGPVLWSQLGSLASFAAALALLWRLSQRVCGDAWVTGLAVVLFATNYSMVGYATGGLETMLQAALICGALLQAYALRDGEEPAAPRALALSLTCAAAVLTRMDSALPVGVAGALAASALVRRRAGARPLVALALPFALVVASWLGWKAAYYGQLLPNTFTAKVAGWPAPGGIVYLGRFLHWYALWPFLLLGALLRRWSRVPARAPLWPLVASVLAWFAYAAWLGGDFMEFRFLVPVGPLLFLWLAFGMAAPVGPRARPALVAACALTLAAASARHATTFRGSTDDEALDSIDTLASFYGLYADGDWSRIGSALARDLAGSGVLLASHASGAIPYYSRLRTIDMFGLNDPEIARSGRRLDAGPARPGHTVHASLALLRERGVHLVLGHPQVTPDPAFRDPALERWYPEILRHMVLGEGEAIGDATLVALPLDGGEGLLMWYLTPHPRIDALVRSGRWGSHRLAVD